LVLAEEEPGGGGAVPVKISTGHTRTPAEHTTAEQTTHTNTERATAQRRLIVKNKNAGGWVSRYGCGVGRGGGGLGKMR